MIAVRRLLAVAAFLAGLAALTCSDVWGEPGKDKELQSWRKGDNKNRPATKLEAPESDLERNRFADMPVVLYQNKGDTYFALQLQPALPDSPALPIDYLVVIDTSASKARGPLAIAQQLTRILAGKLGSDDRLAIWTGNLKPRDLSRGFKPAKELTDALTELDKEVPLGAVNLKKTLNEALASFEVKSSRRRVLVFLGDGKSVGDPLDAQARAALCENMIKKQVAFFAVPLGDHLDAQNLHGLIGGTGGRAVRLSMSEKPDEILARLNKNASVALTGEAPAWATEWVERLKKDVAQPILYNAELKLPAAAREVLPTHLPPLRRDTATLVMGKLDSELAELRYTVAGEASDKPYKAELSHKVPGSDTEHHFLAGIHGQWKTRKDRPALLPADRSLAYAHQQNQLAVQDLVAKAEMALEQNKLDIAIKLYEQALQIDPHNAQAMGGQVLAGKMKDGKKSREDMLKELRLNAAERELVRLENGKARTIRVLDDADEKKDDPKADLPPRDPLDDVKARRRIAEQQAAVTVNEAVRQATRLVRSNPDEAYRILEQVLADVRGNTDLGAGAIRDLETRLSQQMQSVRRVGDVVKRDQAEALALRAAADARLDLRRTAEIATDRVRERLRVFRNLMDQAREEEAYRQALGIREDLIHHGLPVPPAVNAAYQIALTGYHLREVQELKRMREERFLATLLEVERSAVPFPDEPPVEFPSAATIRKITRGRYDNWKDWSKDRIAKYSVATFGSDTPGRLFELRNLLNKTVDFGGLDDPKTTLIEALDQLARVHRVTFDVNEKAFKYEMLNDVLKTEVANPNPIPAMKTTLGTVLKKILARVPVPSGATYLIRRDVIEITTGTFASAEKVVRVYPVADLVFPIPNAFNASQVNQVGSILGLLGGQGFGGALGALGGALGALGGALGGIGGLGALGGIGGLGGLGALGALGALGGGALGALGGAGGLGALGGVGGLGAGGAVGAVGAGGGNLGQVGGFNFNGNVNLGVGGGQLGFTGGQLGQLGNLGGQVGSSRVDLQACKLEYSIVSPK